MKRVTAVVETFARIAAKIPSRLLLVGDGPDLTAALDTARALGLSKQVESVGEQDQILPLLSISDLFLLPSAQESFGLAALEAMACEVPVVASRVGGLHEVIDDGSTGFLHAPDDLEGMAASGVALLTDTALHARVAAAARRSVLERYCRDTVVPRYRSLLRACHQPVVDELRATGHVRRATTTPCLQDREPIRPRGSRRAARVRRLDSFASETAPQPGKTLLRLIVRERGAPPLRSARRVAGLRSVFRD